MQLRFSLLPAMFLAAFPLTIFANQDIGVVDYKAVQSQYFRTGLEQASFTEVREEKTAELAESFDRIQDLLAIQTETEKLLQDPTLSATSKQGTITELRERSTEINELQADLRQKQGEVNEELAAVVATVQAEMVAEINAAISTAAEEAGLKLVQNISFRESGVPAFPYVATEGVTDLTAQVIEILNTNAPEGWEPAPESEQPTPDEP